MAAEEDGAMEVHVGRNIDMTFKGEKTVGVLPVREMRAKGWENRTIQELKSLESKGIRR